LEEIQRRVADGMRSYMSHEGAERTVAAKEVAEALVDARELIQTREGEPDYRGRSNAYRTFVTEALDQAGVPRGDRPSLQSNLRYHVSPILRQRHPNIAEELGINPDSFAERARRRADRDGHIVSLFSGGSELDEVEDVLLVANLARLAVSRVSGVPRASSVDKLLVQDAYSSLEQAVGRARERIG
jgi:hypothetical protein